MRGSTFGYVRRTRGRLVAFTGSKTAVLGLGFLVTMLTLSFLGPIVLPWGPRDQSFGQFLAPSFEHPFGTDQLGRDILVRCLVGSRATLLLAVVAAVTAGVFGTFLGVTSGYFGGWLDSLIMRVTDVLLAIPSILIALVMVSILGPSIQNVIIAISIVEIPPFARLSRASTLSLKERPFVEAAKAAGYGRATIVRRAILPNVFSPVAVQLVVSSASAILVIAALSFLGLGEQPPAPSLGGMLKSAQLYFEQAYWYSIFPGLIVTALVASFSAVGAALGRIMTGASRNVSTSIGPS